MLIATDTKLLNYLGLQPTGDLGPLTGYTTQRGKGVWYLKAPPKTPATGWQARERNRFRLIAALWRNLHHFQRSDWLRAARAAGLSITGYNLFVWYQYSLDDQAIHTVERQSRITLLPLFAPP